MVLLETASATTCNFIGSTSVEAGYKTFNKQNTYIVAPVDKVDACGDNAYVGLDVTENNRIREPRGFELVQPLVNFWYKHAELGLGHRLCEN
jgi:hypothetical protein